MGSCFTGFTSLQCYVYNSSPPAMHMSLGHWRRFESMGGTERILKQCAVAHTWLNPSIDELVNNHDS